MFYRTPAAASGDVIRVALWGCGGHAMVVADAIASLCNFELAGVFVDSKWSDSCRPALRPLLRGGFEALSKARDEGVNRIIVAVGSNQARHAVATQLEAHGMTLISIIHSASYVSSSASVGKGSYIGPGAVVNAGTTIGENSIINTGAIVEHDCTLDRSVHISPGARLAGHVVVGDGSWVGIGATLIDHVSVGADSVIGAGAVVINDIPPNCTAYGVPARIKGQK